MAVPVLIAITSLLLAGLFLTSWKMLQFRQRLHSLISNRKWEKSLSDSSLTSENRIVLFGDSQIELWPICPFFGILPVLNRGISGEKASQAKERFSTDVINLKPKYVVLVTGANDLSSGRNIQSISRDIEEMILWASDHSITALVGSLLPFSKGFYKNDRLLEIKQLNNEIKCICEKYSVTFLDFFSVLADEEGFFHGIYSEDGQHPTFKGYLKMSILLYEALRGRFLTR